MSNLYKILPVKEVKETWFSVIVNKCIEDCRKSLDGTKVVLKLPENITSENDVPSEWISDFKRHAPYLTHEEVKRELSSEGWYNEDLI